MLEFVADPDAFFEARREGGSLTEPLLVVGAASLAGIGGAVVLLVTVADRANPFFVVGYSIGVFGALFGPFVEWLLVAAALFVISGHVGGTGSFRTTVRLAGWGFVPATIAGVIATAGITWAVVTAGPPGDPTEVVSYIAHIRAHQVVQVSLAIGILLSLWSAILWTFAIKHARDIATTAAVLTVSGPVGLSIVWRLHQLL